MLDFRYAEPLTRSLKLSVAFTLFVGFGFMPLHSVAAAEITGATAALTETSITLRWQSEPLSLPVDVYLAETANAPLSEMERVAVAIESGEAVLPASREKPIFAALVNDEAGILTRVGVRLLPLEGGRNFRDLGGYQTASGKRVKWGKLFRSGVMDGLSERDYRYLEGIGVGSIVDFRNAAEREAQPTVWQAGKVAVYTQDSSDFADEAGMNDLFAALLSDDATTESVTSLMAASYYQIALDHRTSYSALFQILIDSDEAVIFNCSAGKDRTGIAAALILSSLGVPREDIVFDYALSDDYVDYMKEFVQQNSQQANADDPYAFLAALPTEILRPLMASHPLYIETALDKITENFGSVESFIREELGLTENELALLRAKLLD